MLGIDTKLVRLGSTPTNQFGYVNPPVYRGSTVLYENMASLKASTQSPLRDTLPAYGRFGTPTCRAFEEAMTELEGGFGSICTSSGLGAITTTILSMVAAGDHILVTDSVYRPTRNFCESLRRFGIETEYYDPALGVEIAERFRPNTRLVYLESPGSNTFEVQDIPAITAACRTHGIFSVVDNTWATPLFLRPLTLGADAVVHSATKYITGHSDSFLGVIVCNEKTYPQIRTQSIRLGQCAGSEDTYFGLRGLRTLATRLHQHERQALALALWLKTRPEVDAVFHPALPESNGHAIWKRDFTGSSGLFSILLHARSEDPTVLEMLDGLRLFGLGHGWGGFESLIVPVENPGGAALLRLHVGFESIDDLKADLVQALERLQNHTR